MERKESAGYLKRELKKESPSNWKRRLGNKRGVQGKIG